MSSTFSHSHSAVVFLSCPLSLTRFFHFSSRSHLQTPLAFPLAFSTFTFLLRPNCPAFSTISPSNHFLSSTFYHSYSALVFLSCPLSLTRFFHFSSPSDLQTPLLAFPLAFSTFTFLLRPHCPAFSTISPSNHFLSAIFSHFY